MKNKIKCRKKRKAAFMPGTKRAALQKKTALCGRSWIGSKKGEKVQPSRG